jgi:hypothetical protein
MTNITKLIVVAVAVARLLTASKPLPNENGIRVWRRGGRGNR